MQERGTAPGAQLPAECSAPGVHGLRETHVQAVMLQVSGTLLQPPAGEQIVDVAFYRDGHLAVLLAAQQRTRAGVRLLLVPTDDLQYLPDLPADSNIMQVRADLMRLHAALLLCSSVLGLLVDLQDCPCILLVS